MAAPEWIRAGRAGPLVTANSDEPQTAGLWKLGLLPFPLSDCLLPGETKQVHLYEARFIQLFADSAAKNNDCLGALLFTPGGNVAAVTTLLEVEEFKKEEYGVWARLKCVGRVKLVDVSQTDYQYVSATCEPFFDTAKEPEPLIIAPEAEAAARASGASPAAPPSPSVEGAMAATAKAAAEAAEAAGVSEEEVLKAAAAMLAGAEEQAPQRRPTAMARLGRHCGRRGTSLTRRALARRRRR